MINISRISQTLLHRPRTASLSYLAAAAKVKVASAKQRVWTAVDYLVFGNATVLESVTIPLDLKSSDGSLRRHSLRKLLVSCCCVKLSGCNQSEHKKKPLQSRGSVSCGSHNLLLLR